MCVCVPVPVCVCEVTSKVCVWFNVPGLVVALVDSEVATA